MCAMLALKKTSCHWHLFLDYKQWSTAKCLVCQGLKVPLVYSGETWFEQYPTHRRITFLWQTNMIHNFTGLLQYLVYMLSIIGKSTGFNKIQQFVFKTSDFLLSEIDL